MSFIPFIAACFVFVRRKNTSDIKHGFIMAVYFTFVNTIRQNLSLFVTIFRTFFSITKN